MVDDRGGGLGWGGAAVTNAGIYVHLPFCAHRCAYCSFVVTTDLTRRRGYLAALEREMDLAAPEAARARFDTVYLGGGTPSLLSDGEIRSLLEALRARFAVVEGAETTLEANPEDVDRERLAQWRHGGVNRISLGVQSLVDGQLQAIERRHTAQRAREARSAAIEAGMRVSCDLILGIPGQTRESFLSDTREMAASGAGHLSIYILELDKAPRLAADRERAPGLYLTDDGQASAYAEAAELLAAEGFEHYEISNWARPGERSRHNAKYWRREPTLGLGVSAHELWDETRRANPASLPEYLRQIEAGRRASALDRPVDAIERLRERILLSARTAEGISGSDLDAWLDRSPDRQLRSDWERWEIEGLLERRGDRFVLTERGFLVSNEVLCRFA
jgi:oxygen-independent coproporphyrinogen-3 oxidase